MATSLFFLPSMLCLLFGFQFFFRKKNRSQRYMMYLLFIGALYFFTYAFYISPNTDYLWLCKLDSVNEPLLLCIVSLFIFYINLYIYEEKDNGRRKRKFTGKTLQWLVMPAIAFGAINMLMYYLVGFDTAAQIVETCDKMNLKIASPQIIEMFGTTVPQTIIKLHGLFNQTIYNLMAGAYVLILIISCTYCSHKNGYHIGDVFRFFCKGQVTVPARAVTACTMMLVIAMAPLLILGRTFFVNHLWAGVAMTMFISISLFVLVNAEMMSQRKLFTIHDIVTSSLAETGMQINIADEGNTKKKDNDSSDTQATTEGNASDILAIRTKHIIEKMHAAFEQDKAYTNPELTVGSMAEMIGTNRTTLSNIINQQYGVTFRDLANRYRIDAAKAYIREHPTATQEEIAVACGFRSASALNHKFKEMEGLPPTLWLTTTLAGEGGE